MSRSKTHFLSLTLVKEGEVVGNVKVPSGDPPEVDFFAIKALIVTVPKDPEQSIPLRKKIPWLCCWGTFFGFCSLEVLRPKEGAKTAGAFCRCREAKLNHRHGDFQSFHLVGDKPLSGR